MLNGTPEQVYQRTKSILQSGVMEGGRFLLREGNNLPPCCPASNLQAMYECCLEHGNYSPPQPRPSPGQTTAPGRRAWQRYSWPDSLAAVSLTFGLRLVARSMSDFAAALSPRAAWERLRL